MNKISSLFSKPIFWMVLAISLYIIGAICMPHPESKYIKNNEYYYEDSEGDVHDGVYHTVDGVGKVLTYNDIYLLCVELLIPATFFGYMIFKEEGIKGVLFSNCIVGCVLIFQTTSDFIVPTILYWVGLVCAGIGQVFINIELEK